MGNYYHDLGNPAVRRLARAMIVARGGDPDAMIPETGYANAELIPAWFKKQDIALDCLSGLKALGLIQEGDA